MKSKYFYINALFFLVNLLIFVTVVSGYYFFNYIVIFSSLFFLFFIRNEISKKIIILYSTLIVFMCISMIASNESSTSYPVFFLSSFVIGYSLSKVRIDGKLSLIYFFMIYFYFLMRLLFDGNLNDNVFSTASRNTISVFIIWACCYVLLANINKKYYSIIISLTILMCIFSVGRSGIISSFLFLPLLFTYTNATKKILLLFFILISIYFISIETTFFNEAFIRLFDHQGTGHGLQSSGRMAVISCYYNKFDLNQFIFGINYGGDKSCGFLAINEYQLHNSYLNMYSYMGIGSWVIIIMICGFYYKSYKNKYKIIAVCMTVILIRAFTDIIMFFTLFDILFWYMIFSIMNDKVYKEE